MVLVIGNAPGDRPQLFNQGYSLAAVIANEFGEAAATPIHSSALFAAGLVLFVLTLIVNIIARRFIARGQRGRRGTGGTGVTVADAPPAGETRHEHSPRFAPISARRRRTDRVMRGLLRRRHADRAGPARADHLLPAAQGAWRAGAAASSPPTRTGNFFGDPGGIRSAILGTLEIVGLASLIAIPIGIGVALYLTEYGKDVAGSPTSCATSST